MTPVSAEVELEFELLVSDGELDSAPDRVTVVLHPACKAPETMYVDADVDGWGDTTQPLLTCTTPSGYAALGNDCDNTVPTVNPGATELMDDGVDNDCDGSIDGAEPNPDAGNDAGNDVAEGVGGHKGGGCGCSAVDRPGLPLGLLLSSVLSLLLVTRRRRRLE